MKLDIQENYREYEIKEEVFKLNVSDDSLQKYTDAFQKMQTTSKVADDFKAARNEVFKVIESMFGDNEAERMFKACGGSTLILISALKQIMADVYKLIENVKVDKLDNYLK